MIISYLVSLYKPNTIILRLPNSYSYINTLPTDILYELYNLLLLNGMSQFQKGARNYSEMAILEYTISNTYKAENSHYKYNGYLFTLVLLLAV